MNLKTEFEKYRKQIFFIIVLVAAVLVRVILFSSHPGGLNQDEASIGYDSWALMNYGIDRNGFSMPVHLVAWGSGQNALYAYLSMPFIALFGLNAFSVRIVNLIFSLLTVIAVYFAVKKFRGYKTALIAMTLVAISPWNIMLSRWGLESNLFPAMFILSIWALLTALNNKKFMYLSAFLFALTMYSYGSAYLVITLFSLISFIYFIVKRLVPVKTLMLSALVFLIFSFPIYLFMIVNVFQFDGLNLGIISIPHTYGERISSQAGVTIEGFFNNVYQNAIMQIDDNQRNSFPFYGCLYVISLPFCIYGIAKSVKKRSPFDIIILNAFVCSMLLFVYYKAPNINRVNSIYLPMIIFTAIGVSSLIKSKTALISIAAAYAICFAGFNAQYFGEAYKQSISKEFYDSFDEAIIKAEELSYNNQTVYVTANVNMPYIYVLFYTQTPPSDFINTVQYYNPQSQFQLVSSFDNYIFNSSYLTSGLKGIYIIDNNDLEIIQQFTNEIYSYNNYSVAVIN